MALFKLLHSLSHLQISPKIKSSSPFLSHFSRTLCSSTPQEPQQNNEKSEKENTQQSQTAENAEKSEKAPNFDNTQQVIQPVSYSVKAKDPSVDSATQESQVPNEGRSFTREEARYMKDMPTIAPVAYASRVAPLPDDRPRGEEGVDNVSRVQQQMRRILRGGREEDEGVKVPFPVMINAEKGSKKKKVYDIKDAIQLVKVCG